MQDEAAENVVVVVAVVVVAEDRRCMIHVPERCVVSDR